MFVCLFVCMFVCLFVGVCSYVDVRLYVSLFLCLDVALHRARYVSMCICLYVSRRHTELQGEVRHARNRRANWHPEMRGQIEHERITLDMVGGVCYLPCGMRRWITPHRGWYIGGNTCKAMTLSTTRAETDVHNFQHYRPITDRQLMS